MVGLYGISWYEFAKILVCCRVEQKFDFFVNLKDLHAEFWEVILDVQLTKKSGFISCFSFVQKYEEKQDSTLSKKRKKEEDEEEEEEEKPKKKKRKESGKYFSPDPSYLLSHTHPHLAV